jgi:glycosyltransferase involved in cell wall biosynthesis
MHLLYLATNFGALTNTFIAREVSALRRGGVRVDLLALRPAGRARAEHPECDLTGCQYLYPVSPVAVAGAVARLAVTRPRRWWTAAWVAISSPGDGLAGRIKLLGQLAVAATAVARVEAQPPQLIHAHLANPPGSYAMFLSLLTGIPYSFTGHAADLYRKPLGNVAKLRHARGAVAISEFNRRHYRELVPDRPEVAVVHCGVRSADFPYRKRERVGPTLTILAVGRAVPKKGFKHLLDALVGLDDAGVSWQADLVGGGPLLPELQAQRDRLGLRSLSITGPLQLPEIQQRLATADVFVLPCVQAPDGDIDGIPVSLMEAMASGCPVISTSVSGIPELLADGQAGLLVPPADAEALAAALLRICREPDLAPTLSEAGRAQVVASFEIDREAASLQDFFARLLGTGERTGQRRPDPATSSR